MSANNEPPADFPSNWGRWGDRDELGTLNFITDEVRARAAEEAKVGRTVSLAMPVTPTPLSGPVPFGTAPSPPPIQMSMGYTGSPSRALVEVLVVNTHHAHLTHIDALAHVPLDGKVYPGVPLEQVVLFGPVTHASTTPFAKGIMTRGAFLDLAPGGQLELDTTVGPEELEAAEERQGMRVESGDALVVRGGWIAKDNLASLLPCFTVDAVRWMAEREVSLIASDIGDRGPFEQRLPMALHAMALPMLGMPLIDVAAVEELAATATELGRWTFLFALGPMAIHGATGIPVNPLAIF